jgi:hypothetical protein
VSSPKVPSRSASDPVTWGVLPRLSSTSSLSNKCWQKCPLFGADPRKLYTIVMLDFGDDLRRALAYACADSPQCRPKYPLTTGMRDMMLDLLERTRIFEPYNDAFRPYGLQVRVSSSEHVELIPLSAVPSRHSRDRANGSMRVFGHATLSLEVTSLAARQVAHPETIPAGPRMRSYRAPNGTLRIVLDVNPDGSSRLELQPDGSGGAPPVIDQVGPLKRVLAEMASTGADPRKLGAIAISTVSVVAQPTLAYACADSPRCRPAFPLTSAMEQMFMDLLHESRILEPYNEALKPYGLQITGRSAENIGLMPLSAVPPRHARDRANGKMGVFGHATLSLRVSPIPASPQ